MAVEPKDLFVWHGEFQGNKLDKKVSCQLNDVGLWDIVVGPPEGCLMAGRLAFGVEFNFSLFDQYRKNTHRFSINMSSKTKREVLNEIVRQNPGYYWDEKGGVVNIQPYYIGKDSGTVSWLDKTIPQFKVNKVPVFLAGEYLVHLANENGISLTTYESVRSAQKGGGAFNVKRLEDVSEYSPNELISVTINRKASIRECLNAIVAANPPARWSAIKVKEKMLIHVVDPKDYHNRPAPKHIPSEDEFRGGVGKHKSDTE